MRYDDPSLDVLAAGLEQTYNLPKGIMSLIRKQGERSHSWQISPKNAKGVYQFTPETWEKFADPGTSPHDPEASSVAAARYLRYGVDRYGKQADSKGRDIRMVLAAEYNGGPARAKEYLNTGTTPVKETREFIDRISAGARSQASIAQAPTAQAPTAQDTSMFGEYEPVEQEVPQQEPYEESPELADYARYNTDYDTQLAITEQQMDFDLGRIIDEVMGE